MQVNNSQFAINVIERLKTALLTRNDADLAGLFGVKQNTISTWKSRNTVDYALVIAKCEEASINIHWLFTGLGEMNLQAQLQAHLQAQLPKPYKIDEQIVGVAETEKGYSITKIVQPLMVTVDSQNNDNIVFVDVKAAAGYPSNLTEPTYFKKLPAFTLPTRQFQGGTFRMFQVDGDSMDDTLKHGSWVIGRFLENPDECKNGYTYVIVTNDSIVFKRVLNRVKERATLVLQSDNPEYRPYEISITDIKEVWDIKAAMVFDLTNKRLDLLKMVNNLVADMAAVQTDIKQIKSKI